MIRIGLVGEDPNDSSAIRNLLNQRYGDRVKLITLVKQINGHQLDSPKIKRLLPIEFADKHCEFVVYIRDLDSDPTDRDEIDHRQKWFRALDATTNGKGSLLLNIWELEALILGDIDVFNKIYNVNYSVRGNPMFQKEPKEALKRVTNQSKNQFKASDCPDIFKALDIEKVAANCSYFKDFLADFNKKLANV